jgi:hypothetical protein
MSYFAPTHRTAAAADIWSQLTAAFAAGDLAKATRLATFHDAVIGETDETYLADLTEI